jgi:hypothetical protein
MTTQTIQTCPEWCTRVHLLPAFEGDDFETIHFKDFGAYSDGFLGMVSVWAEYIDSKIVDKGVSVNYIEMEDSDDLRDFAQVCVEAAKWMDENLGMDHGKE